MIGNLFTYGAAMLLFVLTYDIIIRVNVQIGCSQEELRVYKYKYIKMTEHGCKRMRRYFIKK